LAFDARLSSASVIINARQDGNNVVFDYIGSINISALTPGSPSSFTTISVGSIATYGFGSYGGSVGSQASLNRYEAGTGSYFNLPSGIRFFGDSFAGDKFGYYRPYQVPGSTVNEVFVDPSYASGATFSGSLTFNNKTISGLGLTVGNSYSGLINDSGDTLTLNAGSVAPVPGPLPILGIPAVLLYTRKLKKRIKASREASSAS